MYGDNEPHPIRAEWEPGDTAPKDGSEIMIRLDWAVRAYWDKELKRFVLVTPIHHEVISKPQGWKPV